MKRILVPIDFSDVTGLVVENARLFAKSLDAELKIIHVVPDSQMAKEQEGINRAVNYYVLINYEDIRNELAAKLKDEHKKMLEIKQKLSDEKVKTKAFLLEGKVSEVILAQVEEYNPDIIVMGSHGHGYIKKALLGSVAMLVLKHVKCPVVIIPNSLSS